MKILALSIVMIIVVAVVIIIVIVWIILLIILWIVLLVDISIILLLLALHLKLVAIWRIYNSEVGNTFVSLTITFDWS